MSHCCAHQLPDPTIPQDSLESPPLLRLHTGELLPRLAQFHSTSHFTLNLSNLYAYVTTRLTYANLHSDEAALTECTALLQPLREAWGGISVQNVEHERVNYLKGIKA